ncbi:hypothetical protein KI387_003806, partial [Taxus chinensis]
MSSSIELDVGESWRGSLRQGSTRLFERSTSAFSQSRNNHDEEEALKWAAIEKLPTYNRLRTSILKNVHQENGGLDEVDVRHIELETRQQLLDRLVKVADEDNERLLQRLRQRIDRVGIKLPEVEVRYEHLNLDADVHVGGRALPTLFNWTANMVEGVLQLLHLYKGNKTAMTILRNSSGVVKPGRMTLLLGPPASGKTTLLLALAGKLDKSLRVLGLDICAETMVGDAMQRGISGGQKKRVTTGEMIVGASKALFMDEISTEDIKGWWIWGYWISPLMYAQNGIAVNEFLASRWLKENIGVQLLHSRGLFSDSWWYWLSIGVLFGYNVLFNVLYTLALHYLDPLGKPQALISKEDLEQKKESTTGIQGVGISQRQRGSNVSNKSDSGEGGKKGMVLPFQPLAMVFDNVNYYVDMPAAMKQQGITEDRLQLLRGVSGTFRPGVLTCLMGVSGAGKTTLMDVLAGRKTGGYIEGSITISGYPKKQETFARISGYCEQNDIHSPYVTVHESLIYSAWLRLPKEVDRETREMFVDEVMELVELSNLKGALVGLPGVNGLSTEQRKRLTIAVELVANPSIIFMDEPTSGLDARAAAIVMRTVRNTVDTGRTVVCTIHQPSIDIFESFDELVLMKRGGQMIYVGPLGRHSQYLIDYFEAVEGVPQITAGYNPATWMLESTSVGAELRLGVDFADIYRNSSLYQQNQAKIMELGTPVPGSKDLYFKSQFSQSFLTQTWACLWKQNWSYWRNPEYNAVRFFFTLVTALMFGTNFLGNLGRK